MFYTEKNSCRDGRKLECNLDPNLSYYPIAIVLLCYLILLQTLETIFLFLLWKKGYILSNFLISSFKNVRSNSF